MIGLNTKTKHGNMLEKKTSGLIKLFNGILIIFVTPMKSILLPLHVHLLNLSLCVQRRSKIHNIQVFYQSYVLS